jgi:RimJ/RimL family protein N-acetyltransferase
MAPRRMRTHDVRLAEGDVVLRSMAEMDWPLLLALNNDPEVLYYAEGADVAARSLDEVQAIYRHVSQTALCFVIESGGESVGDCWLQQLNLDRLRLRLPALDCRRIDIEIERAWWGRGLGGAAIRLLVELAFEQERADAVFACDVADYNARSLRLFERQGFRPIAITPQPAGAKARAVHDLVRFRRDMTI